MLLKLLLWHFAILSKFAGIGYALLHDPSFFSRDFTLSRSIDGESNMLDTEADDLSSTANDDDDYDDNDRYDISNRPALHEKWKRHLNSKRSAKLQFGTHYHRYGPLVKTHERGERLDDTYSRRDLAFKTHKRLFNRFNSKKNPGKGKRREEEEEEDEKKIFQKSNHKLAHEKKKKTSQQIKCLLYTTAASNDGTRQVAKALPIIRIMTFGLIISILIIPGMSLF